eukprot:13951489-Alexandrium_andersonii.AAC.1
MTELRRRVYEGRGYILDARLVKFLQSYLQFKLDEYTFYTAHGESGLKNVVADPTCAPPKLVMPSVDKALKLHFAGEASTTRIGNGLPLANVCGV